MILTNRTRFILRASTQAQLGVALAAEDVATDCVHLDGRAA